MLRKDRKQLVGLLTEVPTDVLDEGAQIVATSSVLSMPTPMEGHVTSSYFSARLGHSIALALLKGGRSRIGEVLVDEGLKWRHQETWFGERVDLGFAKKATVFRVEARGLV